MTEDRFMHVRDIATTLTQTLELGTPPVALALADAPPPGVRMFEGTVPSACSFWRRAESAVFYATAAQHFRCPVGAMVMGFEMPDDVKADLMESVGAMIAEGYLGADEPPRIPTVARKSAGVVYGPLRDFPIEPDAVVLWLTPRQAMVLSEASGASQWKGHTQAAALGRPACAAIPTALSRGSVAASLGCVGMRTYTEIADDRMLAVVPSGAVSQLAAKLTDIVVANRAMGEFHEARKLGAA
jgi:uncharacterized protein (DUF169 family)